MGTHPIFESDFDCLTEMAAVSQEDVLLGLEKLFISENKISSRTLAKHHSVPHQKIVGVVKSLQSLGDYITVADRVESTLELLPEGVDFAKNGSAEFVFWTNVPEDGISQPDAMKAIPNAKVGMGKALAAKWVSKDKATGKFFRAVKDQPDDVIGQLCKKVSEGIELGTKEVADLKKRKCVKETKETVFDLQKGPGFKTTIEKPETELTKELLDNGQWAKKTFKDYNYDAEGVRPPHGFLHPLLKLRSSYRQIFLEMGFEEMPTSNFVESSFWNFDALFQPQQHPARDAHDTFFLSSPASALNDPPADYLERVRNIHQNGGFDSKGYGYEWSKDESMKNVLRTHTTAVSAKMLYKLAQQKQFTPTKYFSIDRVFRNETLDNTHLAEFHQVEGLVADYNVSLADLIGVLHEFFRKLGIEKLKFKPAYNPYTEPSMEIFSYHEGLGKWTEIGNSGMFRPEMLRPMGLPENVSVIAWGLSLERPAMIKYKMNNIRELCGYKYDLRNGQKNSVCRVDFERQRKSCPIRKKFGDLKRQTNLKKLDKFLQDKSYLVDCVPSQLDVAAFKLIDSEPSDFVDLARWWRQMASYRNEFEFLPRAVFSE